MTIETVDVAEFRSLVRRMEQLLATPEAQAAADANGNPGAVAAGELIESAWGNAVKDRVVRKYANDAALRADSPPNGTLGWSPDVGCFTWERRAGSWRRDVGPASCVVTLSAPSNAGNATMAIGNATNFVAQDNWGVRPTVEGTFLIVANLIFSGAAAGVNAVVSGEIQVYDGTNPTTPKATATAFGGHGTYWQGMTVAAVYAMAPASVDYVRVLLGGDATPVALDSRSRLFISRIGPTA